MYRLKLPAVLGMVLCLGSVLHAAQWELQFTDSWDTPISPAETHAAVNEPFGVFFSLHNNSGDGSAVTAYDYGLTFTYDDALSYIDGSFQKTDWAWGGWTIDVVDDPGAHTLTLTSSSPTITWGHDISDGGSRPFGSFQFQAEQLNVKDYGTKVLTPWPLNLSSGVVYTADDLSSSLPASNVPTTLDVYTDGQRELLPPETPLGQSATMFSASWRGKASVENTQHWSDGTVSQTDAEDNGFDRGQAYRTTVVGMYGEEASSYAWSNLAGENRNSVFSLEANAQLDSIVAGQNPNPTDPFTSHALAEIAEGNMLGLYDPGNEDTPMRVTISAGFWSETTEQVGFYDGEGTVDWECTVRLNAADGDLLATLDPDTMTVEFVANIGDNLYFDGFLDALAETGLWSYNAGNGLYYAEGAFANSKLDIWVHTKPVPEPGTAILLATAVLGLLFARGRGTK